jgi:hypothetical protein
LDGADIDAAFQEVGREGMPQGVAGRPFVEAGLADSFRHLVLPERIMEV